MPKYPFTPANFQQKITDIYALSDPDLLIEATAVKENMVQWITDNFVLTTEQETFLTSQNEFVLNDTGASGSLCFLNRLDIYLTMQPPIVGLSKFFHSKPSLTTNSKADGTFTTTGSLTISIVYE